ncbi:MAG TPA: pitrilysin family protein [Aliidongia sp.]|nr:pitrilysin family protein [Aliidongia sp.]
MSMPRISTLPNGMRIVTDTMAGVETASLGVWVDVGTRNEPAEINGVAHLLEHMAFKGTERRSARAIAEEIENVGGHLNAYTSREQTAYYARILKDDVPLAVDILSDILQNSVFDPEELERERTVILQEIGQALDTPDDLIFDRFQERAFPDQGLGRPVLGQAEIIRTIGRERIAGYMSAHYGASRMVLSAAGAVDHDRLVALAGERFGGLIDKPVGPADPAAYVGGDQREGKDLEQVHLVLGFPSVGYTDPDYYAISMLATLLGGGMSSRLFQEVREKRGLVYTIYAFAAPYEDGGLFGVYAGTGEDEVTELMPVLCDELVGTADSLNEAEIARTRAQLKASLLMGLESSSSRAEHFANQMLIYGRPLSTAEIVARIDEVDKAMIARAARRIFAAAPTFAALGPIDRVESFGKISERLAI